MKRLLAVSVAVCLLFCALPPSASAAGPPSQADAPAQVQGSPLLQGTVTVTEDGAVWNAAGAAGNERQPGESSDAAGNRTGTSSGAIDSGPLPETGGMADPALEPPNGNAAASPNGVLPEIEGSLDEVSGSVIRGWAWDKDLPNEPLLVRVYYRNLNWSTSSSFDVMADQYRGDLHTAGKGNGYHAFSYNFNWLALEIGTYEVSAVAFSGFYNDIIGEKTFELKQSYGYVDEINLQGVRGWAWNPSVPNFRNAIHVYVLTADGTVQGIYKATADQYRGDLPGAGIGDGKHAYFCNVPWSELPREVLTVRTYAVDGTNVAPLLAEKLYNNAPPRSDMITYINPVLYHEDDPLYRVTDGFYTQKTKSEIEAMAYTPIVDRTVSRDDILNNLPDTCLWVICTHGSQNELLTYLPPDATFRINLTYDAIDTGVQDGELSDMRLALLLSCSTGEGADAEPNLVNLLHEKGALTAIGWQDEVYTNGIDIWAEAFFTSSSSAHTIEEAIADANTALIDADIDEEIIDLIVEQIYISGSRTQRLAS